MSLHAAYSSTDEATLKSTINNPFSATNTATFETTFPRPDMSTISCTNVSANEPTK